MSTKEMVSAYKVAHYLDADLDSCSRHLAACLYPTSTPTVHDILKDLFDSDDSAQQVPSTPNQHPAKVRRCATDKHAWRELQAIAHLPDFFNPIQRACTLALGAQLAATPAAWRPVVVQARIAQSTHRNAASDALGEQQAGAITACVRGDLAEHVAVINDLRNIPALSLMCGEIDFSVGANFEDDVDDLSGGIRAVCDAMTVLSALTALTVSELCNRALDDVAVNIASLRTLRRLDLSPSEADTHAAVCDIIDADSYRPLSTLSDLTSLSLRNTLHMEVLQPLLPGLQHLRHLRLTWDVNDHGNLCDTRDGGEFAQLLQPLTALEVLEFTDFDLDQGPLIAAAVAALPVLSSLTAGLVTYDTGFAEPLAKSLAGMSSLTALDLSPGRLEPSEILAITAAAPACRSLRLLNIAPLYKPDADLDIDTLAQHVEGIPSDVELTLPPSVVATVPPKLVSALEARRPRSREMPPELEAAR